MFGSNEITGALADLGFTSIDRWVWRSRTEGNSNKVMTHDALIQETMPVPNSLSARLAEPAEVFEQLTPEEADLLVQLLERKVAAAQLSLDQAIEATFAVLPRLIRIPARKILFGK
ncbi:hypothetical protein FEK35_24180 [Nocardia cyriacigeorgica]|uniref:Uncharacterized protein n=1 Tax=Nocardia cyriacigeorgica TaxID=135487 RepID=A0A5R8P831_9NOCA|nr:hypothetical protein [Nocardia cyriacigeorgica]TLG00343.1 hypothetical protein FEK35_24180 [Nocardia cyriacigeorgica]